MTEENLPPEIAKIEKQILKSNFNNKIKLGSAAILLFLFCFGLLYATHEIQSFVFNWLRVD